MKSKKRNPRLLINGLPRSTLKQTQVTGERLAKDFQNYYSILAKKHTLPIPKFNDALLIDTAQAILNSYIVEHRWLKIENTNMNPSGDYIYTGGKARMQEAMKKELANPTKKPLFLYFRKMWWKHKFRKIQANKLLESKD